MTDPTAQLKEQLRKDQQLLDTIKAHMMELERLKEIMGYEYEDKLYRMYYKSFKVYQLQRLTLQARDIFQRIAVAMETHLHPWFVDILSVGTNRQFELEHNHNWLVHTRPIVEAFLHAKFFLEMMVKCGRDMDRVDTLLSSGWAALLVLYNQR